MNRKRMMIKLTTYASLFCLFCLGTVLLMSYLLGPPHIGNDVTTQLLDHEGNPINTLAREHATLPTISPHFIEATILVEDQHYYDHHGFDFRGIARAVIKNMKTKRLKEGASTISQQLARNLYLSHEKTWARKLKEAFFTIRLEMFYSKDTILSEYVNTIYYGHGAYGVEAASNVYFQKQAHELTLAEAAMLAGIPKGPTYYSPFNDLDSAVQRQHFILKRLLQTGKISEAEYYTAIHEQLDFSEPYAMTETFAGYFNDFVWQEAEAILHDSRENLRMKGLTIHTTLHREMQEQLENTVEHDVLKNSELDIGVLSIDPETGAILQMVGGKNYTKSTFNRAVDAKRMVGSTFKTFLYYTALEHGYTATTMLQSEPTAFVIADEAIYEPSNFNDYYAYEPISLAQAIALSDNIYAVKTNLFLSPEVVARTTRKFGIHAELPHVPSLALGSASISLLEMVAGYGVIANGGLEVSTYAIDKITNQEGKIIYERKQQSDKQVLDPHKTFILIHLMTGMFDRRLNGYMEVTGSSIIDELSFAYAGKSGTTEMDSWMIGFSPRVVTGVWTGYDDNRPLQKLAEKALAKKIWAMTMENAHRDYNKQDLTFEMPDGIVKRVVDVETGLLATVDCPVSRTTYFEKGTEPTQYCQVHLPAVEKSKPSASDKDEPFYKRLFDLF